MSSSLVISPHFQKPSDLISNISISALVDSGYKHGICSCWIRQNKIDVVFDLLCKMGIKVTRFASKYDIVVELSDTAIALLNTQYEGYQLSFLSNKSDEDIAQYSVIFHEASKSDPDSEIEVDSFFKSDMHGFTKNTIAIKRSQIGPVHNSFYPDIDIDKLIEEYKGSNDPILILHGSPGTGKCFAKGTLIRMYDGSTKKVEDIQNGEYVMGDDSTPRLVSGTTSGQEEMFKVTPIKGSPFTVNKSHILVLVDTHTDKISELSVADYLDKSNQWKSRQKLYRMPVRYGRYPVKIDPYFVGLWLGDGNWNEPSVANVDKEIIVYVKKFAKSLNFKVKLRAKDSDKCPIWCVRHTGGKIHPLKEDFRSYGLMLQKEKFIPREYLINDEQTRLDILAGLLDSDGHLTNNGFEITTKYLQLANDIQELALSLGFWCSLNPCEKSCVYKEKKKVGQYFRLFISGDTNIIPTKVRRKQATTRRQVKNVRRTGFAIESIGQGNYYGFMVDGNHRFLLANFIVTHNTTFVKYLITNGKFKNIAYIKDPNIMGNGDLWSKLTDHQYDLIIFDDLDIGLLPREKNANSNFMTQLLSFSSGVFSNGTSNKIIITTNQTIKEIDAALVREGRCFDFLELQPLNYFQAKVVWVETLQLPVETFDESFSDKPEIITQALLAVEASKAREKRTVRSYIKTGDKVYSVSSKLQKLNIRVSGDNGKGAGQLGF